MSVFFDDDMMTFWSLYRISNMCFLNLAVPVAAPENVRVLVQNSTLAEVQWDPVPPTLVRGRLHGYIVCVSVDC